MDIFKEFSFWLFLGVIFLYNFAQWVREKRIEKAEYKESLQEGAIEEPHAVRDLTREEHAILQKLQTPLTGFINSFWSSATIGLIIFTIVSTWGYVYLTNNSSFFRDIPSLLQISGLGLGGLLCAFLVLRFFQRQENQYHRDLGVAVWEVQGTLIKLPKPRRSETLRFVVRKQKFTIPFDSAHTKVSFHLHGVAKAYENLTDGSEVLVQYSPFSHFVWKVEKTEDKV